MEKIIKFMFVFNAIIIISVIVGVGYAGYKYIPILDKYIMENTKEYQSKG